MLIVFGKVGVKDSAHGNIKPTVLHGKQGDKNIVHEFTEYYKKVCQPNTVNADSIFQDEVNSIG